MPLKFKHVDLQFDNFTTDFSSRDSFEYVQLAKHVNKNSDKKILFVFDYVPSEDLKSGRLLSGVTGKLLNGIVDVTNNIYNEPAHPNDFNWLAISYHAFRTKGKPESFVADAQRDFAKRLKYVITTYKPDIVITFGPDPYRCLNGDLIHSYNNNVQHLYGVPIPSKIKTKDSVHKFKHIPTLSLNTLINDNGGGAEMSLAGYVARNLSNAFDGNLKYKVPKLDYSTVLVEDIPTFKKMMKYIRNAPYVAIDTETENLNRRVNKMLTIQFATNTKRAFVLPIFHKDSPFTAKELKYIIISLRKYFEGANKNLHHIYANASFDLTVIRNNCNVRYFANDVWDLFAGEFAFDENMKFLHSMVGKWYYSLLNLSMQYGCDAYYKAEFGKDQRKTIVTADLDDALVDYCALDVIVPMHIMRLQMQRAEDIGYEKYPLLVGKQISDMLHTFSTLEYNGAYTDIDHLFYLKTKDSPILKEIIRVKKALKESKGVRRANAALTKSKGVPAMGLLGKSSVDLFDISKDDHIQLLFFDILKLKPLGYGKPVKGVRKPKVDKKFQKAYKDRPEVALFSELKAAEKLFNSYVKAFIKQWGSDADMRYDRRIRPHFEFLGVVTGRTSAKKPSLHQIPSRSALGKHIKRLFITEEGRIMIKVDYSAHEVRCLSLESYVSTEIGMIKLKELIEMVDKPRVHSFNHKTEQVELKEVGNESIHTTDEDMYEIEYEGGTITVTGNHKVWSKTRNAYVRADSIEEGEELLIDG